MKRINKKGFTLIEIITIIVILGIVMTIAVIGVNKYIQNVRNNTYKSYIKNIETAAENKMVECVTGKSNCDIPEAGYSENITIQSLIEDGYSDKLKDPEEEGSFCSGYVEVKNEGASVPDLKYTGCLKCSKYETDGCNFEEDNDDDNKILACDELNAVGTSTKWISGSRTIKFGCNSEGKECKYQKTFEATPTSPVIKEGDINILGGETCKVNVYIDKTKPTCELIVGESELGEDGWYLEDVEVRIKYGSNSERDISDFDFGISTSTKKEYNGKDSLTATTGITTVFGYVKDDLGNEGYCSTEIKIDSTKPAQELMLGYQIYPEERNTSTTGTNEIVIDDLEKYKSIKGILVFLKEDIAANVSLSTNVQTATGGLGGTSNLVSSNEEVMDVYANNTDLVEFILPTAATYGTITIAGIDPTNIDKIMLLVGNTDGLYTNKDMIVYNFAGDNGTGVAESKGYSFDGGTTWQSSKYKLYEENTTVTTMVRDSLGTKSDENTIKVNKIDKESPTCNISGNPTSWTNRYVNLEISGSDGGVSGLATISLNSATISLNGAAEVDYTGSYNETIKYNGVYTYEVKDKAGNAGECKAIVSKIDRVKPTVSIKIPNASTATKEKTATITIKDQILSKLQAQTVYYGWGTSEETVQYQTATIPANSEIYSIKATSPKDATGTYYLFVKAGIKDNAGNVADAKKSAAVNLDNIPPKCPTIKKVSGASPKTWTNSNIVLNVQPTTDTATWKWAISEDGGSNYTELDEEFVGSKQFMAFSTEGKKSGRVRVTDSAGNTALCTTDEYWIDKTAPTEPELTMTHSYNSEGAEGSKATIYTNDTWINETVYMTDARYSTFKGPSSSDTGGSELKEIQISSDKKTWETYSYDYTRELYRLQIDGTHYRYFRAIDNAGNISSVETKAIKLDKTAPTKPTLTMTHSQDTSKTDGNRATVYTNNTWINKNIYMTDARYTTYRGPSSSDSGSGLKEIQISSDKKTWETYSYDYTRELYRLQTSGTHYRYFRAIDNVGNVSSVETKTIKLDKTAPTVPTVNLYKWKNNSTAPTSSSGLSTYTAGTTSDKSIYTTACDGSSDDGVGGVYYQYTTTGATTNETNVTKSYRSIKANGTSYIKYRACDILGNCSAYTSNYKVVIQKEIKLVTCNVRGSKKRYDGWGYTCTRGHWHGPDGSAQYYRHYCKYSDGSYKAAGSDIGKYICPTNPYGTGDGWEIVDDTNW